MPPKKPPPKASPLVDAQTSHELGELRAKLSTEFGDNFFSEVHATSRFPAFDAAACKKALTDSGEYSCQGNILWAGGELSRTMTP